MRDILTSRRPNRDGVPPEGLTCYRAAESCILGLDSGAGSAGPVCESGGCGCSAVHPRDRRGAMITPTGGITPAAPVVRGQTLHDEREGHSAVVLEMVVASRESVLRMREPVGEGSKPSEDGGAMHLSLGPVPPRLPDWAALVDMQCGYGSENATGLRSETALQMGRQMEDVERTGGHSGGGSGARDGQGIDGTALVRVRPVVGAVAALSMSGHPGGGGASELHLASGGGVPSSGGFPATEVSSFKWGRALVAP